MPPPRRGRARGPLRPADGTCPGPRDRLSGKLFRSRRREESPRFEERAPIDKPFPDCELSPFPWHLQEHWSLSHPPRHQLLLLRWHFPARGFLGLDLRPRCSLARPGGASAGYLSYDNPYLIRYSKGHIFPDRFPPCSRRKTSPCVEPSTRSR